MSLDAKQECLYSWQDVLCHQQNVKVVSRKENIEETHAFMHVWKSGALRALFDTL